MLVYHSHKCIVTIIRLFVVISYFVLVNLSNGSKTSSICSNIPNWNKKSFACHHPFKHFMHFSHPTVNWTSQHSPINRLNILRSHSFKQLSTDSSFGKIFSFLTAPRDCCTAKIDYLLLIGLPWLVSSSKQRCFFVFSDFPLSLYVCLDCDIEIEAGKVSWGLHYYYNTFC